MPIEITNLDIGEAERVLLPSGRVFNEERRAFIRCMESRDVIACPGSGKTTALLAKLIILSKKAPIEIGGGICVLTHTNVAIDEIKRRAGAAAESLFRYPNYFGTIQGFVNQFLAAPWYRSEFKNAVVAVDNDRYYGRLHKHCSADYALRGWLDRHGGVGTLGGYWIHPQSDPIQVGANLESPIPNLGSDTPTFSKIQTARRAVLAQGVLSFHDAYSLALRYFSRNPSLGRAIRERFKMVFIDEAQDTAEHQIRVLEEAFPFDKVIIQRIGDTNQAIFSAQVEKECFWIPRQPLHFSDSQRFGRPIAKILESVRVNESIALSPNQAENSISPQIITFQNGEEQKVLKAFAYMIGGMRERIYGKPIFKAIGWIGRVEEDRVDKLCIPSYYPSFKRFAKQKAKQHENLFSYCESAIHMASRETLSEFAETIFMGIAKALDIAEIRSTLTGRSHTPNSIRSEWRSIDSSGYSRFRSRLSAVYLAALSSDVEPQTFRNEVKSVILEKWACENSDSIFFLDDNGQDSEPPTSPLLAGNRIEFENGIGVDVATVHSVKGETHTATLFMETHYYSSTDSVRLMEFLKGSRPLSELQKVRHIQNLKVAHVAFSRPTLLLVFACRAESIVGHEDGLRGNGWEIQSVSELV